jgi:HEAT repeat protein
LASHEALQPLTAALADPEGLVRLSAARGLGLLGDSQAAEALSATLGDAEPDVAQAAAEALVSLGSASAPALAHALAEALKPRREPSAPWGAFGSEGWIGACRLAIGVLLKLASEPAEPAEAWASIRDALRTWKGALGILSAVPVEVKQPLRQLVHVYSRRLAQL